MSLSFKPDKSTNLTAWFDEDLALAGWFDQEFGTSGSGTTIISGTLNAAGNATSLLAGVAEFSAALAAAGIATDLLKGAAITSAIWNAAGAEVDVLTGISILPAAFNAAGIASDALVGQDANATTIVSGTLNVAGSSGSALIGLDSSVVSLGDIDYASAGNKPAKAVPPRFIEAQLSSPGCADTRLNGHATSTAGLQAAGYSLASFAGDSRITRADVIVLPKKLPIEVLLLLAA